MILSKYKSDERQGVLFPVPLRGHGHVRNVVGELAERLTQSLVRGRRHRTQGNADYCPDVSVGGTYYESKAVGRSGTAFVYAGRLEKDRLFAAAHPLYYVVWRHSARTVDADTEESLRDLVLSSLRTVYFVPFAVVDSVCSSTVPSKLNSGYGGTDRKTYGSGYRIRLSLLEQYGITITHPLHENLVSSGEAEVDRGDGSPMLPLRLPVATPVPPPRHEDVEVEGLQQVGTPRPLPPGVAGGCRSPRLPEVQQEDRSPEGRTPRLRR